MLIKADTLDVSHPAVFADVVKQLSSRHVLHDHEEVCGGAYHLVPVRHTGECLQLADLYIRNPLLPKGDLQ